MQSGRTLRVDQLFVPAHFEDAATRPYQLHIGAGKLLLDSRLQLESPGSIASGVTVLYANVHALISLSCRTVRYSRMHTQYRAGLRPRPGPRAARCGWIRTRARRRCRESSTDPLPRPWPGPHVTGPRFPPPGPGPADPRRKSSLTFRRRMNVYWTPPEVGLRPALPRHPNHPNRKVSLEDASKRFAGRRCIGGDPGCFNRAGR